jgi:signal transduction histidine kinase/ActR/RegA family two-component response regulator
MSKLKEILALIRLINADEFEGQLTEGDGLDDIHKELMFLFEKMESKKRRTEVIIDHISNCYAGDFFNLLPISEEQDELDVFCMGFNTYIEELKAVMVSKNLLETMNEKLIDEKERSDRLAIAKDEFMASMSHEIRTPLNGILGFTDLLIKNPTLDAETKKQLDYIKMSGDILLVIINDILDLAKIESGQITLSKKPFNLPLLTQLIYDTFSNKTIEKKIKFKISIDENVPTNLIGDSIRISQILFNLVSNAVKFTRIKGKIKLKIKLTKEVDGFYYIKMSVKDTGIGIPSDKMDEIFNPFIQVSEDTARKYGGTGLGLAIIKKIITLMDGEIEVESILGIGTKFTVTIPFQKPVNESSIIDTINNEQLAKPRLAVKDRKIKVLLAEDNRINQILAQKVLSRLNFVCTTVENGKLAVEAVKNEDFDIVLMDIMMPVMNGYDATLAIRGLEDDTKRSIPIIALSAIVTGSVSEICISTGIDAYLSKPFDINELYNTIIRLAQNSES